MVKRFLMISGVLLCAVISAARAAAQVPVSYICVEAETRTILIESNADIKRPPASMLKMMQMLLVEEGVQAGKWNYNQQITATKHSQNMGGTQVYLKEGESFSLEQLMKAICVHSANDASVAVAEGLWGSVDNCLVAMNQRAAELGMLNTRFYSVHGLPPADGVSFDQTTAREMAILALKLLKYPKILTWTSMREYALRPTDKPKESTNKLLKELPECDGLKTGYIRAAGFCLTATAQRNGIRLVAVVMGSDKTGRFTHTKSLLEQGFQMVTRVQPVQARMPVGKPVPVEKSMDEEVRLLARDPIEVIVRVVDADKLTLNVSAPVKLEAPLEAETEIGTVKLMLHGRELGSSPLILDRSVEKIRLTDYGFGCMGRKE
ncbi:MAG TPA: D-alanyl-D-alanine carboxypeptidase family protein [Candidatus Hydrogenedentes bacterium]|nr:D-alanyl-D-alanine carboxypeptidase family protein [Candidatus Hydrogenedentota bacterium]HOH28506.1 D-alanyl-D-alanine carboxypeptidase family protein [Candidatus Hydrogenedentota bacterium]